MECAAYARQSVENKNSLSIEGQLDLCWNAAGRELKVYEDRGYSGKNTERPAFQKLIRDIKDGKIARLYVYRLDRFSRSVAEFGNLWEILQANNVEFISVNENFDTSTPMGMAMLHIIMVFAQLERVKDNYYRRADRLVDAFASSRDLDTAYLHRALSRLEQERQELLDARRREQTRLKLLDKLDFAALSFEDKKLVAAQFIRQIDLYGDHADIVWNV